MAPSRVPQNNNASSENDNLLPNGENVNPVPVAVVAGGGTNQNNVRIAPSSVNPQPPKKRRYNRHTPQQKQHMEAFFKECPHPDEKQRRELGRLVGLNSMQIKFWFQNKRTQVKNILDRSENDELRTENQDLRAENESYRQILDKTKCLECGGPPPPKSNFEEQKLIAENFLLRQEIEKVKKLITNLLMQATQKQNINIAGTSLNNDGVDNNVQHNGMLWSFVNQGLIIGNVSNKNKMAQTEGVAGKLASQDINNNMSMSLIYEGLGNLPPQDNYMPPSSLFEGLGNLPSQDNNNFMFPVGDDVASQYNNIINMMLPSSSSINQGQGVGVGGSNSTVRRLLPIVLANGCVSDKPMVIELAVESLEEFQALAVGENNQLWVLGEYNAEILNEQEYLRTFPKGIGPKPMGFRSESSRESMVVPMNHISLIEILMDVGQWSRVFCGIVSKAEILEVVSKGPEGSYDGCLQLMSAQFQMASTYVPAREYDLVRYCKQLQDGSWAVVDVSLDSMRPSAAATSASITRRRPSGCLIQALPDGFSTKVTWIEHVEVDDKVAPVPHRIYKPLIDSCLAFGAKRWMSLLNRQCQRIAAALITHIPQVQLTGICTTLTNRELRKSLMKLSERMVRSFHIGVGACTPQGWAPLTPTAAGVHNNVRIMTRKVNNEPGWPTGIVIGAATSFHLAASPHTVFDFIRNENFRTQWDILAAGGTVEQVGRVENGRDPANCVSMLRVESSNPIHRNLIILQESGTDSTGSVVVFSPLEMDSVNALLGGQDPDTIAMLPSGFAIFPDAGTIAQPQAAAASGGCLVTLAFQIMIESDITKKLSICSVSSINNLVKNTVEKVKVLVNSDAP